MRIAGAGREAAEPDPLRPFVARALDAVYIEARFRETAAFAGSPASLAGIRVTRWKPGRRCLVEYDLRDRATGRPLGTIVGKIRAKSLDRATCSLTRRLAARLNGIDAPGLVGVPGVVGTIPECHMWLQEKVAGASGWAAVTSPDGAAHAARIGAALATLQQHLPPLPRTHGIAEELALLDARLSALSASHRELSARLSRLAKACERLAEELLRVTARGIHRDFYHDQVILDSERVWVLDLDLAAVGDPSIDAGNFIAHLQEQSLREFGRPDALAACERAFVDAFCRGADAGCRSNVEIYSTLSLVRHVHISSTFEARRRHTTALLELCERRVRLRSC